LTNTGGKCRFFSSGDPSIIHTVQNLKG
jgi:hypothetical protein